MARPLRAPKPDWAAEDPPREEIVLTRPPPGKRAFGYQLTCVRDGALKRAVQLFWQLTREERYEDHALAVEQQERLVRALASCDTQKTAKGVMALHLVIAAELRPTSKGFRAQGPRVFFGIQHEPGPNGERLYVPKERQAGLTERMGACVRTLQRYWAVLIEHGVWAVWRPKRDDPDARLNAARTQVYKHRWLVGGTPQAVRDQLPVDPPRSRAARAPAPSRGVAMRPDELREALAYIDGAEVPY